MLAAIPRHTLRPNPQQLLINTLLATCAAAADAAAAAESPGHALLVNGCCQVLSKLQPTSSSSSSAPVNASARGGRPGDPGAARPGVVVAAEGAAKAGGRKEGVYLLPALRPAAQNRVMCWTLMGLCWLRGGGGETAGCGGVTSFDGPAARHSHAAVHKALDACVRWYVLLCLEGLYKLLIHLGSLLIRFLRSKQQVVSVGWLLQAVMLQAGMAARTSQLHAPASFPPQAPCAAACMGRGGQLGCKGCSRRCCCPGAAAPPGRASSWI
jgi:hypothetical protein